MAYAKVTEGVFTAVKILEENGATIAETAKYMKLSDATVKSIRRSQTFEEYKNIIAAYHAAQQAKKASKRTDTHTEEPRQTVTIQATHYMMEEMRKTNEMLKLISAKLAFIVDELCGTKGGANVEKQE